MRHIYVNRLPGRHTLGIVKAGHLKLRCALGRSGIATFKREGDGASPRGVWPLRQALYRADRRGNRPATMLPVRALRPDDGWCDAPFDSNYNRSVRHPYRASAERMWRSDQLYDLVIVVGHNDRPRVQGAGSAIFVHVASESGGGLKPTEGCIALRLSDLRRLVAMIEPRTRLHIG
ncbi:MAG: hypothetical protein APF80_07295 [Alphaproteobacteria bacterium BRH_c36]|nr:MAG: hypothetical protein APF80_07295 [Alphaproteobacteria bacterium BRH_c36]